MYKDLLITILSIDYHSSIVEIFNSQIKINILNFTSFINPNMIGTPFVSRDAILNRRISDMDKKPWEQVVSTKYIGN